VSVTKPEKIGEGVNTYVQYTVKSKGEDDNVQEVIRRYSDFDWLHDLLRVEFPSTLIPPLPEKAIMNRFSPEFLESRRQGLDRFLARVLNHPALSLSADVKIFIQGSDQEIQLARQRLIPSSQVKKEPEEKKGFLASLTSTISTVSTNISSSVTGVTVTVQEVDSWFDSHKDYLNNLEQNLTIMQTRSNAHSRKKQELMNTYTDFSHSSSQLSATEVGHDELLAQGWSKISEVTGQMATVQGELALSEIDQYEKSIKDYILLVRAAKDLLENRSNALLKLQTLEADTKSKQERLSKNTSAAKTAALTTELQQAQAAEAEQKSVFEKLSKEIKEELEKFTVRKGRDLRKAASELVRQNMNAHLRVVGLWKEVLADLEEKKQDAKQKAVAASQTSATTTATTTTTTGTTIMDDPF